MPNIDWLPILTGEPSKLFESSDYDAAMAELDEYLKPNLDESERLQYNNTGGKHAHR